MIYLDNAATTRVSDEVLREMLPYFTEDYGNPDSVHAAAKNPVDAIAKAEKQIRSNLIHTSSGKIIFTSGGTESNNMAINLYTSMWPLAVCIVTSATEHKSVLAPAKRLMRRNALETREDFVILSPGSAGAIRKPLHKIADLMRTLDADLPTLYSFMYLNNETGMQNDVYAIGETLEKYRQRTGHETFFHVDCVQAAGELPIYPKNMHADLISVSAHKFHGPKGVGCLWISDRLLNAMDEWSAKSDAPCRPVEMIIGGGQQDGLRAGTINVPGIVGLGAAAARLNKSNCEYIAELAEAFNKKLVLSCERARISTPIFHFGKYGNNKESYAGHDPKVLSIGFPGADAETVVMIASKNGLCISNGAACNSVSSEPSYVLLASGLSPDMARSTVRVSFSIENTIAECEEGAEILAESVKEALSLTDLAP